MIEAVVFYSLGGLMILSALVLITRTNPIASALALVVAFAALAGLFGLLSAGFAAVIQVLVYAGGIMVLIIFVIMILNLRQEDLIPLRASPLLTIAVLGCALLGVIVPVVLLLSGGAPAVAAAGQNQAGFGGIERVGELMFGKFLFPFEMLSLVLLTAVVGALVIAKRRL